MTLWFVSVLRQHHMVTLTVLKMATGESRSGLVGTGNAVYIHYFLAAIDVDEDDVDEMHTSVAAAVQIHTEDAL